MTFKIRDLSVLAYARGFTLWHYKASGDEVGSIGAPGFFDAASDMLALGDMVMVSGPSGGRVLCVAGTTPGVMTAPLC